MCSLFFILAIISEQYPEIRYNNRNDNQSVPTMHPCKRAHPSVR